MTQKSAPVIDMTPDGNFIEAPRLALGTILARLAAFAILLSVAALTFWTVLFMLPFLLVLGVAGYVFARAQMRRQGGMVFRRTGRW